MRYFFGIFSLASIMGFLMVAYNNFTPFDLTGEKLTADFKRLAGDVKHEQYVQINGKFYERNERGVYYIDGVPTFVKKGKFEDKPKMLPRSADPRLGPPIDPKIYKDAMGLDSDDEFFKPKTTTED